MTPQANLVPQRKVIASTLAAAVTTILVWALAQYAGVDMPGYVQGAVTAVFTFLAGYFTKNQ